MKAKSRLFVTIVVITSTAFGGLFLSNLFARQRSTSPNRAPSVSIRAPVYTSGNFTFTAPLELTGHPPSPAFFQQDGEPEISADIFGTIYVTAIQGVPGGTDLWKSTDKGATFAYLGQPDGAQDHCNPPVVQCAAAGGGDDQIDVSTGGYLYVSALWLGNVTMSTSLDGGIGGAVPGQAWEVDPAAAAIVGDDRQWVAAYGPQTVGMTYAQNPETGVVALWFVKSTDGGKTWGPPVQVTPVGTPGSSINVEGNLVVDPYNGNFYTCYIPASAVNSINLASSTDGGMTWNVTTAYTGPAGSTTRGVFPIMAVDRGGNLHLVFTRTDSSGSSHVFLTSTADPADSVPVWVSAVQVDSGLGASCEAWMVSGSPGTVDIAWLGTSASSAAAVSNWNVFFAQVTNSMSANPTIAQNQVETASMHDGSVCFNGGGCNGTPHGEPNNRDMLEYFRINLDPDGNANIAYSDSINNCNPSTCVTNAWYAKQTGGASAYNPPAAPPPATFAANLAMPNSSGTAEPNSWTDSYNCIFGGAIGGPIDFISKDAGMSFTEHAVVLGTGLHGGDFDIKTLPQASGARPDQIYTADLGVSTVHIGKSTDGGNTYFQPGTMGAAGEVSVSSDRMWLYGDRGVPTAPDQTIYLMDHEFTTEAIRFSALTNDVAWSPFTPGTTASELILPPTSTLPNTNPGPTFVDKNSHMVYGLFGASSTTTNTMAPPFGKEPNLWEAAGAAPTAAGLPPGPFTDFPVFKGLIDSPAAAPSPAPSIAPSAATIGSHVANIFPSGTIDSAGNVYAVWSTNSTRYNTTQANNSPSTSFDIWFAASHDGGQNFYGPWKVSSGTGTSVFPWIAAGDNGRVSICWYQTSAVAPPLVADPTNPGALSGGPNNMPTNAAWNVMFAQSLNANAREPVFSAPAQASDHVIHTGSISNGGTFGSSDRSLLDFFSVSVGPDGLSNIFCADNDSSGAGTTHINYMRQASGPLAVNNPSAVTCLPIPPLASVVSTMTHGGAGTFTVNFPLPPNSSPRGVECRTGVNGVSGNYSIVFSFANNLTSVAGATVSGHNPSNGTGMETNTFLGPGPNQCTVNLTNVSSGQYLTVMLNNVTDMAGNSGNVVSPQLGFLVGDVNTTGGVDGNDVSAVQSQTRHAVTSANFRDDVNANGVIDGNDVSATQGHTRTSLPSSP